MKAVAKLTLFLLAAPLLLALVYYTADAVHLRSKTPQLFEDAVAAVAHPVSRTELADWQRDALLAIQDPNFFRHDGTDFGGGVMTTITQALAKQLYFDGYERGVAKIRQSVLARFALDAVIAKDDQLDLFLGSVYLGHVRGAPVHGFREAAQVFFGKPLQDLRDDEFLALLATLPAPNRIGPHADPDANAEQARRIAMLVKGDCRRAGLWHGHRIDCPAGGQG